jgi:hypothetical protein
MQFGNRRFPAEVRPGFAAGGTVNVGWVRADHSSSGWQRCGADSPVELESPIRQRRPTGMRRPTGKGRIERTTPMLARVAEAEGSGRIRQCGRLMHGHRLPVGRRCCIAAQTSSPPRTLVLFKRIALGPLWPTLRSFVFQQSFPRQAATAVVANGT